MFRDAIARVIMALSTVPPRWSQGRDGLRCSGQVINLSNGEFSWSLRWLKRAGFIANGSPMRSWFRSYDGTPTYRLTRKGWGLALYMKAKTAKCDG